MSYKQPKSKFFRLPYELSNANGVKDNFTVQFKPKYATLFRASDEYTKYIDDDYSKFLNASVINANAAATFSLKNSQGPPPAPQSPMGLVSGRYEAPDLTGLEDKEQQAKEEQAKRAAEMGRDIAGASSSGDILQLPATIPEETTKAKEEKEEEKIEAQKIDLEKIEAEKEKEKIAKEVIDNILDEVDKIVAEKEKNKIVAKKEKEKIVRQVMDKMLDDAENNERKKIVKQVMDKMLDDAEKIEANKIAASIFEKPPKIAGTASTLTTTAGDASTLTEFNEYATPNATYTEQTGAPSRKEREEATKKGFFTYGFENIMRVATLAQIQQQYALRGLSFDPTATKDTLKKAIVSLVAQNKWLNKISDKDLQKNQDEYIQDNEKLPIPIKGLAREPTKSASSSST